MADFIELNGYYVKDAQARADINKIYNDGLIVSFPIYGVDGEDTLGDCSILKSKSKSMMIDCFSVSADFASIERALSDLEIEKLNYLLITHYHADHYGHINNLISGGYLNGATVILPRTPERWDGTFNGSTIKSALNTAGINWIECNNQTIMLDDAEVKLFNGSAEDYAYYDSYTGTPEIQYNDYSIYCNVIYKDHKILFTGDGDTVSTEYVLDKYLLSDYDLLKDNHHGYIQFQAGYASKVNPKYVVTPASKGMVNLNLARWMRQASIWTNNGASLLVQGYQTEPIKFKINTNGLKIESDSYVSEDFTGECRYQYYVDSTTENTIRNGSVKYPFKTLHEAAIFTPKLTPSRVEITVLNIEEDDHDVYFEGFHNIVLNMNNNAYGADIRFYRCEQASIKNAELTSGHLVIEYSNVSIEKFTYSGVGENAINIVRSDVSFTNALTLNVNSDHCIQSSNNSNIYFNISGLDLTFANASAKLFSSWGCVFTFTHGAIAQFKQYPFASRIMLPASAKENTFSENYKELLEIYTTDTATYENVTTSEAATLYPYYEVVFTNASNHVGKAVLKSSNLGSIINVFPDSSTTEVYVQFALIKPNGTTVEIARKGEIDLRAGTPTLTNASKLGILKITGVIE